MSHRGFFFFCYIKYVRDRQQYLSFIFFAVLLVGSYTIQLYVYICTIHTRFVHIRQLLIYLERTLYAWMCEMFLCPCCCCVCSSSYTILWLWYTRKKKIIIKGNINRMRVDGWMIMGIWRVSVIYVEGISVYCVCTYTVC